MKHIITYLGLLSVTTIGAVYGLSKEEAILKVTVRLVRKDWRPQGYDPGTDEPLAGFVGSIEDLYHVYRSYKMYKYVSMPLSRATQLFNNHHYNSSQPSVILTHPLTIGDSGFIVKTVGALALRNLQKHYNIFAMHAPRLSLYFQTTCARTALGLKTMFEPMAEAFASFLIDGYNMGKINPGQISFIGFSYSATLNAYMARLIRDKTGYLTHTVLAVDAFQHNYGNVHFTQVSASDAKFVHMIHSSSYFGGTQKRVATVDIVLNNGFLQPGCDGIFSTFGCSHRRSVLVFFFSLISAGNVVARQCDEWTAFYDCKCNDAAGSPMMFVSFPVNEEATGVFYVRTSKKLPYILGPKGAYCKAEHNNPLPYPFTEYTEE